MSDRSKENIQSSNGKKPVAGKPLADETVPKEHIDPDVNENTNGNEPFFATGVPEEETIQKQAESIVMPAIIDLEQKRKDVKKGHSEQELASMVAASRQIANMAEPSELTPQELAAQNIIYSSMYDRRTLDKYRELRTKLIQAAGGENKITMVASAVPGGGATHVALNLAVAFALDESKTSLLIDCNLRDPALNERLYLDPDFGLTDFLEKEVVGVDGIIYATGIPRLRLIPVGQRREATSEFFTSLRMRAFLDVVKRRYPDRHIFIDAPAVDSSADTRILAELCDRAILVVPYGRCLESQVEAAVDAIGEEKLAGIVLNN